MNVGLVFDEQHSIVDNYLNMSVKILANLAFSIVALEFIGKQFFSFYKHINRKSNREVLWSNVNSKCCDKKKFSPNCPNKYCSSRIIGRLIQLIDSSQYSVCLAMYTFNCQDLKLALMRAHLRHVRVKIVTTNVTISELNEDLIDLMGAGVEVRFPKHGLEKLLHHKFCLLDADKSTDIMPTPSTLSEKGVVLTGSMNWTLTGLSSNRDNIVLTSDPVFVKKYQKEFNKMWQRLD